VKKLSWTKWYLQMVLLLSLVLPTRTHGQEAKENGKESGITREQAEEILSELRQIRQFLQEQLRQGVPSRGAVPLTGVLKLSAEDFTLGSSEAPVTIVEFTDYECPYCRQFRGTTFAEIRKKYVDTGIVRFVSRDFPVDSHSSAIPAAVAAHCAGAQQQFWTMSEALFAGDGQLTREGFIGTAEALKLDIPRFVSCLDASKQRQAIQDSKQLASSLQIQATPSFLVGRTQGDKVSGTIIEGAQPLRSFEELIRRAEYVH
jgi:protein-disulfide isomerase